METTPNGLTLEAAVAFSDDAEGMPNARVEIYLGLAHRRVKRLAPEPEAGFSDAEEEAGYREAAREAEALVFDYLVSTRGFVKVDSLSGVSSTHYGDDEQIARLVAQTMGEWYRDPAEAPDSGTAYHGPSPKAKKKRKASAWWAPEA